MKISRQCAVGTAWALMVVITLACSGTGRNGKTIRQWASDLESEDNNIRYEAVRQLVEIGSPAVGELGEALQSDMWQARQAAAEALGRIKDPSAVKLILATLAEDETDAGWGMLDALIQIGAPGVPELIEALEHKSAHVRWGACYVLGKLNAAAKPAVPVLIQLLKDEYAAVRINAALALGDIGDPAAVTPIITLLNDSLGDVRLSAVTALDSLGADAEPALKPLAKLLDDPFQDIADAAAMAIENISKKIAGQ